MRIDSDWNHYAYTYGEPPRAAEVRFDVACALQPAPATHQHGVCLRVLGQAADFQARLTELLADVDCWLVGVMTYQDVTCFVLQVEDDGAFEAEQEAIAAAIEHEVEWQVSRGWDFFEDRVCPTDRDWQRISDREQLEKLAANGVDVRAEHAVSHSFFGHAKELEPIRARLVEEGFEVVEHSDSRLTMQTHLAPADISKQSVSLAKYALDRGALYDGWRVSPEV